MSWLAMWRTAHRLRPPLLRLGIGPRIANYLLVSWRDLASAAAAVALIWCAELWSGRTDLAPVLREIGFRGGRADQLAVLSMLLFGACYAINLSFLLYRQWARLRSTAVTVNMVPNTVAETVVYALVLAPVSGITEEIVFRGALMWAFTAVSEDPISAVASHAVLFGIVHLYQGGLGVLRTVAVGLVLGAGTLACGSLIPAMIAHSLINAAVAIGKVSTPTRKPAR
jgi:membrane protease YdiL (CAAX protease family)